MPWAIGSGPVGGIGPRTINNALTEETWLGPDGYVGPDDRAQARVCEYACGALDEQAIAAVRDVERQATYLPIVLVTDGSRDNARALKDILMRDVVWLDRAAVDLSRVLDEVKSEHRLADRFARIILPIQSAVTRTLCKAVLVCTSAASAPTAEEFAKLALSSSTRVRD